MKSINKYLLSALATAALSVTLAGTAAALCRTDVQDQYTCYPTGEDANYCYYDCYCKVGAAECDRALIRNGYESY
ncbi:MAG TPA: hypothetical protein VF527_10815 [Pyrinomonadaceae bacterium]|jgi:hypothetical protein